MRMMHPATAEVALLVALRAAEGPGVSWEAVAAAAEARLGWGPVAMAAVLVD